ncbi:MAG: hypothetical protein WDM89_13110 [Rhizomicrobium sp.]
MLENLDENVIRAAFAQPNNDGSYPENFRVYLRTLGARRSSVILAFPPKAAGTFLRTAAIVAVNGQLVRAVHAQGGRDAQPYLPIFLSYFSGALGDAPLVTHMHLQGLPANRHFFDALDLRPAIMVRSITDMLASYRDMLDADSEARAEGLNCTIPADYSGWEQQCEEQLSHRRAGTLVCRLLRDMAALCAGSTRSHLRAFLSRFFWTRRRKRSQRFWIMPTFR